ncbi:MAG TPA: DUF1684 domain-containing protein [Euzebyales bacterium]
MAELALLDWRRRVAELYARIRANRDTDPLAAHDDWATTRDRLFSTHAETPLDDPAHAQPLVHAAYDPSFAWSVAVDTDVERQRYPVATSGGGEMDFVRFGRITLPIGTLDVFWLDAYGGGVFLPFRDATAGETTYGGGRYLLDTVKGADLGSTADGRLIVDFNFAYHPSCHYSPRWSCPLAPPGNGLDAPVPVGELLYPGA